MTRLEIRNKFRVENPEITSRVITDAQLNEFCEAGDLEICCISRCIMSNESEIISSVVNLQYYDLETQIDKFYDIDDMPGGGVYYNDLPLKKTSLSEMNYTKPRWKTASAGTPKKFWRRGKYLWLDVKPATADLEIAVDCVYIPDPFDADDKEPFNEIGSLQPYAEAIIKYLQWRCKQKIGKHDEAAIAEKDYSAYVNWMKKRVSAAKYSAVYIKPA